jgi:hypothetical protein
MSDRREKKEFGADFDVVSQSPVSFIGKVLENFLGIPFEPMHVGGVSLDQV